VMLTPPARVRDVAPLFLSSLSSSLYVTDPVFFTMKVEERAR
jgi:hypothetical protein